MSAAPVSGLPLWEAAIRAAAAGPMVRRRDRRTCRDAADRVRPVLSPLRLAVLDAVTAAGEAGLTDKELERLPQFAALGFSTARKRRSELYQLGYLREAGVRDRLTVWTINPEGCRADD